MGLVDYPMHATLDDVGYVVPRVHVRRPSAGVDDRNGRAVSAEVSVVIDRDGEVKCDQHSGKLRNRFEDFGVARAVPKDRDNAASVVTASFEVRREFRRKLLVEYRNETQAASASTARSYSTAALICASLSS